MDIYTSENREMRLFVKEVIVSIERMTDVDQHIKAHVKVESQRQHQ